MSNLHGEICSLPGATPRSALSLKATPMREPCNETPRGATPYVTQWSMASSRTPDERRGTPMPPPRAHHADSVPQAALDLPPPLSMEQAQLRGTTRGGTASHHRLV